MKELIDVRQCFLALLRIVITESQPAVTCLQSTIEPSGQCVKSVQYQQ